MTREQVDALRAVGIDDKTIVDLIISETAAAVTPGPAPKPEPAKQDSGREDKILAAIEKLTGAIYNHNVLASGGEDQNTESAEDIIGKMLRKS